jgi:hypothetical protein
MSLFRQFVDIDQPAAKPAVRPILTAEPDVGRAPVCLTGAPNKNLAVRQVAEVSTPGKSTVRASKESWNQYHAELMRRRRSVAKLDAVELATVDA